MLTKYKIFFVIFFLLFFIFASNVSADVVINEVFPNPGGSSSEHNEFIELFNNGSAEVIITDWTISDTGGSTKTYTIPETTLVAGGFIFYRREKTTIALNNTGDGVELKDNNGVLKDSMSFGNTASYEDKSWSRVPNGTGNFVKNTEPTEGRQNAAPPTPSPSPTPTPDPPEQTASPSPSPAPATSTPKAAATKKPTSKPKVIEEESDENGEDFILGLREELKTDAPSSDSEGKKKFPVLAGVFIVGGLGSIGFAGFSFIRNKRKKYNGVGDNNEQGNRPESL